MIKKICMLILLVIIVLGIVFITVSGSNKKSFYDKEKIQIVVSNFACYDFIRAIIGDSNSIELSYLLGPGKDAHSYEPTSQDLIKIQNSNLFIYIGGESESWTDRVIGVSDNNKDNYICIANYVDKVKEEEIDGAEKVKEEEEEEEESFDDHIWTSPSNAIKMINILEEKVISIDPANKNKYKDNSEKYIRQINEVDSEIRNIVENKKRNRLVFGDRMPMQYFINYYGLNVSAVFNGCSTDVDPSANTIAYIESKVKEEKIPVVLYIELNNGRVAKNIAQEVGNGCNAMQIQTLHNISENDFKNGETWVSLMRRNEEVLKKALCY